MTIKDRIKDLCVKNGITVNKLETSLGFGTGYISKLNKSTPNTKKIQMIADFFNVSVDYLMTGKEPADNKYSSEMALLVGKLRKDKEMSEALLKYFDSSIEIKKHIVSTINMLCDSSK